MLPTMPSEHFSAMMSGLDAVGLTRVEIAAECNLSHRTVRRLAGGIGREPTGRKIGQLHQKVIGERPGPQLIGNAWSTRGRPLLQGLFDVARSALGTEKVRLT